MSINDYYDVCQVNFGSAQGVWEIVCEVQGSGYGVTYLAEMPISYNNDWIGQVASGAYGGVWLNAPVRAFTGRHLLTNESDLSFAVKVTGNTFNIRIKANVVVPSGVSFYVTVRKKSYIQGDANISTFTDLSTSGTDATTYSNTLHVVGGRSSYNLLPSKTITNSLLLTTNKALYISGPTTTLDVDGDIRARYGFADGLNSLGSSGNLLSSTGSATQWVTAASIVAAGSALTTATSFSGDVTGVYNNLQLGSAVVGATELASTAVTPGTYGGATSSPVITIDADGRITSASNTTITDNDTNIGNTNLTLSANRTLTFNNNNLEYILGTGTFKVSTSSTTSQALMFAIGQGAKFSVFNAAGSTSMCDYYHTAGAYYAEARNRAIYQRGLAVSGLIASNYSTKDATFYVQEDGYVVFPDVSALTGSGSNKFSWGATAGAYEYLKSGAKKTVVNMEDDLIGAALSVQTANFNLGDGNRIHEIVDAVSGNITVTVGSDMREGVEYVVKCRRNGTNTITFSAGGSHTLDIDTISTLTPVSITMGAGGTGIQAPYKVYHISRSGNNIFIN